MYGNSKKPAVNSSNFGQFWHLSNFSNSIWHLEIRVSGFLASSTASKLHCRTFVMCCGASSDSTSVAKICTARAAKGPNALRQWKSTGHAWRSSCPGAPPKKGLDSFIEIQEFTELFGAETKHTSLWLKLMFPKKGSSLLMTSYDLTCSLHSVLPKFGFLGMKGGYIPLKYLTLFLLKCRNFQTNLLDVGHS